MYTRYFISLVLTLSLINITAEAQSGRVRQHEGKNRPASGPARTPSSDKSNSADSSQVVPKGTIIELRLDRSLSSKTSAKGEEFAAGIAEPVFANDHLVLTTSAAVKCHIINVQPAARKRSNGSLTIGFDELVLYSGDKIPLHATLVSVADKREDTVDESGEGKIKDKTKGKNVPVAVGTSAGDGAPIGAISGAGAGTGAGVGAGVAIGSILLSKGQDVELLSGYRLQIRLDADLILPDSAK